jgi:hypothetical protein
MTTQADRVVVDARQRMLYMMSGSAQAKPSSRQRQAPQVPPTAPHIDIPRFGPKFAPGPGMAAAAQ